MANEMDVAPALYEAISKDFHALLGDAAAQVHTYADAQSYAERVGDAMAEAFRRNLSGDALPDGRMYWNIADRTIRPILEEGHRLVTDATVAMQQSLNDAAGLGLLAQRAPINTKSVENIMGRTCSSRAKDFDDVSWMLSEPVRTFARRSVDNVLRANAEFQAKAGLAPKIHRTAESGCCEWCSKLEGVYQYPDNVPDDVYRRHDRCRCRVEYDPGDGSRARQDVWSKRWTDVEDHGKIEERKLYGAPAKNNRRKLPDVEIFRSVGAKARNYEVLDLISGERYHFAEGTRIQDVEVFCGLGTKAEYRQAWKYAQRYGGEPEEWQHVKGHGILSTPEGDRPIEVHWSQHSEYGRHDFFVKRWEDE